MYITVIDKNKTVLNRGTATIVDSLFEGTYDTFEEPDNIIRTRTYNQERCTSNTITVEMMTMFCNKVLSYIEEHPNVSNEYNKFKIPKKTHGFREINAPKPELKSAMKDIANALTNYLKIKTHDCAWAYVKHRDVVSAMKEHTNNESKWFLKLDLHDFFGSCSPEFIYNQLFKIYPFAPYVNDTLVTTTIRRLSEFACLNSGLPQGTPLSPILTNLIMVEIDYKICQVLKGDYVYTRYADDIIISSKYSFDYNNIINNIKEILNDTPLVLNEEKTRYGSSAGRNWNLGIMCNKDNKLTLGYKRKQKLKATIHNYMNNTWELEDLRWLLGNLSWLRNVEPDYFKGLLEYCRKKYQINIWNKIIYDIKSHSL